LVDYNNTHKKFLLRFTSNGWGGLWICSCFLTVATFLVICWVRYCHLIWAQLSHILPFHMGTCLTVKRIGKLMMVCTADDTVLNSKW